MHLPGYYSSGEFARLASVTVRTIRFYDRQNILKPSYINENGARFYTDSDLARLQQILLLKYLGFSLDEIRETTIDDTGSPFLINSLFLQQKLVQDRIEQMQLVQKAISDTMTALQSGEGVNWENMLELIHLTNMENSLATQYRNTSNLSARIRLHTLYSVNRQGWFPWLYEQCQITPGMEILETGCGAGSLWSDNLQQLPENVTVHLSDISEGMIRDVRRSLQDPEERFQFSTMDAEALPFPDGTAKQGFDLVLANHVLFYCESPQQAIGEAARVLKPGGRFICSTYSSRHMIQITRLVQEFDSRIVLSADKLYEKFGLENGTRLLEAAFGQVEQRVYEDELIVDRPEPLIEYILSCHGNQNQYVTDRYAEFRQFVSSKVEGGFHITKEAGIFICTK